MQPVVTAIGAILIAAASEGLVRSGAPAWCFFAAVGAAAAGAAAIGRFVLVRLAPQRFGRAATASILALHAAVVLLVPLRPENHPWADMAGAASVLPALAAYMATALATYRGVGRPHGFGRVEWLAPRLLLIPLAPLVVLHVVVTALGYFPAAVAFLELHPSAQIAGGMAAIGAMLVLGPLALVYLFPSRVMAGAEAARLRTVAERAGVRCRALVVWHTGARGIVNACVAGVIPQTRFVFVTDGLLNVLAPEEVEAVFAHEVSHVRCHHVALLFMFVLGAFGAFGAADAWIARTCEGELYTALGPAFAVCWWGGFLLGPFAWVSRILELEADLRAVDLGADPTALVRALDKLRACAPRRRGGHSWRHFSIPYRIRAILDYVESASARNRFRRAKRAALGTVLALCALGAALNAPFIASVASVGADRRLEGARDLLGGARSNPGLYERVEAVLMDFLAGRGVDAETAAGRRVRGAVPCAPEDVRAVLVALDLLGEARAGAKKFPAWLPGFNVARCLASATEPCPRVSALAGAGGAEADLAEAERELRAVLAELQLAWDGLGWVDLGEETASPGLAGSLARTYERYAGFKLLAEICAARGDEESAARANAKAARCFDL